MVVATSTNRNQSIAQYFNSMAPNWYRHTNSMRDKEFDRRTVEPILKCIREVGKIKAGENLSFIDVGCGIGYWSYEIFNRAYIESYLEPFKKVDVWLLDISSLMLEEARYIPYYYKEYSNLNRLVQKGKLEFKFVNLDLKDLDTVEHPHFDVAFFHKVLSMVEYGKDVEKTFLTFGKTTDFLANTVKAKPYYMELAMSYLKDDIRRAKQSDDGRFLEVLIPHGETKIRVRKIIEENRVLVNDDEREGGKKFLEYTYDSSDLINIHNQGSFKIIPSYKEMGVDLSFVGKPVIPLRGAFRFCDVRTRQEWYPLLGSLSLSRLSPNFSSYSSLLSL